MPQLNAIIGDAPEPEPVEADMTKLKGYARFKFFLCKEGATWYVCEYYSGQVVGEHTNQRKAKAIAREYLADNTQGDLEILQKQIEAQTQVNT
jgi:hypothetical protein